MGTHTDDDLIERLRRALDENEPLATTQFWRRTIQAHREILRLHESINVWPEGTVGAKFYTGSRRVCRSCDERTETPCPTLRALASIYFPEDTG